MTETCPSDLGPQLHLKAQALGPGRTWTIPPDSHCRLSPKPAPGLARLDPLPCLSPGPGLTQAPTWRRPPPCVAHTHSATPTLGLERADAPGGAALGRADAGNICSFWAGSCWFGLTAGEAEPTADGPRCTGTPHGRVPWVTQAGATPLWGREAGKPTAQPGEHKSRSVRHCPGACTSLSF